ncbi:hypothetical protein F4804DRAFT_327978 [Jackrogersella minutella]|nr:hypothetical protein F4804DRAFT_327978 [Jackrogersella minutella]
MVVTPIMPIVLLVVGCWLLVVNKTDHVSALFIIQQRMDIGTSMMQLLRYAEATASPIRPRKSTTSSNSTQLVNNRQYPSPFYPR